MQGAQMLRSEAYLWYVATTKNEAQRRPSALLRAVSLSNGRWAFYEAVKAHSRLVCLSHKARRSLPCFWYNVTTMVSNKTKAACSNKDPGGCIDSE